jgi:ribosomal-protein-serine acetyltransferase
MEFDNYQIRLLQLTDLDSYFQLVERNRKRLEDFFTGTVSRTNTLADTQLFVEENLKKCEDKTYFPYLLEDKTSGKLIGFFDIKNIDWNIPKAELGCYTDERYAGKGITSKAFSLFVMHCFEHLGFRKLFLRTHQRNISAQRLAEKNGFDLEGKIRCDYKTTRGEVVDLLYYGKLHPQFDTGQEQR